MIARYKNSQAERPSRWCSATRIRTIDVKLKQSDCSNHFTAVFTAQRVAACSSALTMRYFTRAGVAQWQSSGFVNVSRLKAP